MATSDNVVGSAYVELGVKVSKQITQQITDVKKSINNQLKGVSSSASGSVTDVGELVGQLQTLRSISFANLLTQFDGIRKSVNHFVKSTGVMGGGLKIIDEIIGTTWEKLGFLKNSFIDIGNYAKIPDRTLESLWKVLTYSSELTDKLETGKISINNYKKALQLFGTPLVTVSGHLGKFKNIFKEFNSELTFKRVFIVKNLKNIKTSLKEAFNSSDFGKNIHSIKNSIKLLTSSFPILTTAIGTATAALAAFVKMCKTAYEQASKIDEIGDAASKLGTSYSSYSKYSKMGEILAYDTSDYETAFKKMRVNTANASSDTISAYEALGIDYESLSSTELFDQVVEKLQNVQDETQKTAIAYDIFGKGATNLTPLLNGNMEQINSLSKSFEVLGATVSDKAAANADIFENNLYMLKQAIEGLKNSTSGLIPFLSKMVAWATEIIGKLTIVLDVLFGVSLTSEDATDNMSDYTSQVDDATEAVKELKSGLRGFDELNNLDFSSSEDSESSLLDEDDLAGITSTTNLISEEMEKALEKVEKFKNTMASFQEKWGEILPWIIAIVCGTVAVILCLLGHPLLAVPFMILAGAALAGIAAQISGTEDLDGDGHHWDDYFTKIADKLGNSGLWITMAVGVVTIIAGLIIAIFGAPLVGVPLIVAGAAILGAGIALGFTTDQFGESHWAGMFDTLANGLNENTKWCFIIGGIIAVVGGLALAIGGLVPLGVGAFLLGLASIGVGVSLGFSRDDLTGESQWGEMLNWLGEKLGESGKWIFIAVGLVGIIGGILLCIIGLIPLGVGAIIAGIGALGLGVALGFTQSDVEGESQWGKFFNDLWEGIKKWANILAQWFIGIVSVLSGVSLCLMGLFALGIPLVKSGIAIFKTGVDNISNPADQQEGWDSYTSTFQNTFTGISQWIKDAWDGLCEWWDKHIAPIFTKEYWSNLWDNVKSGFKSGINAVLDGLEKGINWMIDKINSFSFDLPDWLGGGKFGFDIQKVSIPRLATGGIATKSTFANIGEDGAEAILPLERNTEWMDKLAEKINGTNSQQDTETPINLYMDGKIVARAMIKNINQLTKTSGKLGIGFI